MIAPYVFAFCIGIDAGLRSLTPLAAVSWAARFRSLNLQNSALAFMGSVPAVIIFSLLAIAELVGDKLPTIPSRISAMPLTARIVSGGFSGACLCVAAGQSWIAGAALGAIGGLAGSFAGYKARTGLVNALKVKDIVIALTEDLITIALAYFLVTR